MGDPVGRPMNITITNKHLERALIYSNPTTIISCCPLALAVQEATRKDVRVGTNTVQFPQRGSWPLSGKSKKLVDAFTDKEYVKIRAMLPLQVEFPEIPAAR